MKTLAEKQAERQQAAAAQRAKNRAEMLEVAKLFGTQEGKRVLELLMRKFGVLSCRFDLAAKEIDPVRAAVRDGATQCPIFILQCLREAGETEITLPL